MDVAQRFPADVLQLMYSSAYCRAGKTPSDNAYARPLDFTPVIDLNQQKVTGNLPVHNDLQGLIKHVRAVQSDCCVVATDNLVCFKSKSSMLHSSILSQATTQTCRSLWRNYSRWSKSTRHTAMARPLCRTRMRITTVTWSRLSVPGAQVLMSRISHIDAAIEVWPLLYAGRPLHAARPGLCWILDANSS